ncbi:hypothetical protein ACKVMT_10670 [Halobacteriales archaeon Cl-PHB]
MDTDRSIRLADEIVPATVKQVVREALVVLGLLGAMALGTVLPGTGHELPGTAVSLGDTVVMLSSLGIVATLVWTGPKLRELVITNLDGPTDAVRDAASVVRNLLRFVAVLVAHWGFAPVFRPLLEAEWLYDLGFLVLAVVPLGLVAYRFYQSLDPLAEFVTSELLGLRDDTVADGARPSR